MRTLKFFEAYKSIRSSRALGCWLGLATQPYHKVPYELRETKLINREDKNH